MNGIKAFFPTLGSKFNTCHDDLGQFCSGNTQLIEKWVNNPSTVSSLEKEQLINLAKTSKTNQTNLERIVRDDPQYYLNQIVDLDGSFTGIEVSKGKSAGEITWKSSDGALIKIINPSRGYDIPYASITSRFGASREKETLVSGKYKVKEIKQITEPGTNPIYGYTVPQYILEEI